MENSLCVELLSGIGIGIITGLISGLYTGLVVSKFAAFCQTRMAIFDILRRLEAIAINGELDTFYWKNTEELPFYAQNMIYLGHKDAGIMALTILKEVDSIKFAITAKLDFIRKGVRIPSDSVANIKTEDVFKNMSEWQKRAFSLRPTVRILFTPNLRL